MLSGFDLAPDQWSKSPEHFLTVYNPFHHLHNMCTSVASNESFLRWVLSDITYKNNRLVYEILHRYIFLYNMASPEKSRKGSKRIKKERWQKLQQPSAAPMETMLYGRFL